MTAAQGFNVLYALLTDWVRLGTSVDLERVDDFLEGVDPDAGERAARILEGKLRAVVG